MANQFYEERISIPGFSLSYCLNQSVESVHKNIQVDGKNKSILFLYIKSLNVSNMRMPFKLPDNDKTPQLCFIEYYKDDDDNIRSKITHIKDTQIFTGASSTTSLDRFVELLNRCINYYVYDEDNVFNDDEHVKYVTLTGQFTVQDNKLQYIYTKMGDDQEHDRIAVLGFNSVFVYTLCCRWGQ